MPAAPASVLAGLLTWAVVAGACALNQVIFQRDAGVTAAILFACFNPATRLAYEKALAES